jgi:hypothetical protein
MIGPSTLRFGNVNSDGERFLVGSFQWVSTCLCPEPAKSKLTVAKRLPVNGSGSLRAKFGEVF